MAISIRDLFVTIGFDIDEGPIKQIDRNIRNVQKNAKRLAIVFTAAAASVGVFLNEAAKFEQVEIAFETMLGSAEKAQQLLKEMADFAAKTPFTLPGVEASAKQLLAVGIESDKIIGTLKALGDVSAGLSVPLSRLALNFGQVKTQGKLTGRELRDFAIAGVPLLDELAKQLNKSKAEITALVSAGKIGFPEVEKAFISMTSEGGRFFDLMDKQSKSFFGIMSNILDVMIIQARAIGKGLLPQAKAIAKEFLLLLEVNRQIIKQRAVKFFQGMAKVVGILFKVFKATVEAVLNFSEALGGLENVIKTVTFAMLGLIGLNIISGIGAVTIGIFKIVSAVKTLGFAALVTQAKMIALPVLVGAAVIALGLIIEDIIGFFRGKNSLTGELLASFENKFPEAFGIARDALLTFKDTIGVVIDEAKILGGFLKEFLIDPLIKVNNLATETLGKIAKFSGLESLARFFGVGSQATPGISPTGNISNQSSTSIKIDAPITIPAGSTAEEAKTLGENAVKGALGTLLRQTGRAVEPQVEF